MRRRGLCLLLVLSFVLLLFPVRVIAAVALNNCEVCIVEIQTQGITDASEEYIVVANLSPLPKTDVNIQYLSASGTKGSSSKINLAGSSVSAVIAPVLKPANLAITGNWPAGMSSTSGTVQAIYQSNIMDQVGWGAATQREGTTASAHAGGGSLVRQQTAAGVLIDTGNNANDFVATPHVCSGLSINEIQPFLLDNDGNDIDQALELLENSSAVVDQDCPMRINGTPYAIASGDLATSNGLAVITSVLDSGDQAVTLPLLPDVPNTFQFVPRSLFGAISLPGGSLTQPLLITGQSYAKFLSSFKATYQPTVGVANQLLTTPPSTTLPPIVTEDDCANIVVNELLPNPIGDDSGNEWVELRSTSDQTVWLANCSLVVNGTQYPFSPDQSLAPDDLPIFKTFTDGITTKILSLKNSGMNTISFGDLNVTGSFVPLQTVQYQDAPEGQSWVRFDDGWRWLDPPTPGQSNDTPPSSPSTEPVPTEFPAPPPDTPTGSDDPTSTTASTTTAKLLITEILPNPAPPQTDENDEFVELFNPGADAVDLDGYKVQTGSNYSYSYTIENQTIAANGYLVLTSGATGLTLANTAGRARLLDPSGTVLSETDPYEDAKDGLSWALIDGSWQWTGSTTPGVGNVLRTVLAASTKKSSTKTTAAKVKTTAIKLPKAAKASKKTAKKTTTAANIGNSTDPPIQALHPAVLVAIGGIALLYGAYEYRSDLANAFYKFRRNRADRRTDRR